MNRSRRNLVFLAVLVPLALFLAIPRFDGAGHWGANGSATISGLRTLSAALAESRAAAARDGASPGSVLARLRDAVGWLSDTEGTVRAGYRLRVRAAATGTVRADDPSLPRECFVVHAWPESERALDDRVFVLDARGSVWSTHDPEGRFRGAGSPPPDAYGAPFDASAELAERTDALGVAWKSEPTIAEINASLR